MKKHSSKWKGGGIHWLSYVIILVIEYTSLLNLYYINTIQMQTKKALGDEESSTDVHKPNTLYTPFTTYRIY
jgi:hypothetical protein